jgi:hypothetical protein
MVMCKWENAAVKKQRRGGSVACAGRTRSVQAQVKGDTWIYLLARHNHGIVENSLFFPQSDPQLFDLHFLFSPTTTSYNPLSLRAFFKTLKVPLRIASTNRLSEIALAIFL